MEISGVMELFKERKASDLSFKPTKIEIPEEVATFQALKTGLNGIHEGGKSIPQTQLQLTIAANVQAHVRDPQEISRRFLNALKEV